MSTEILVVVAVLIAAVALAIADSAAQRLNELVRELRGAVDRAGRDQFEAWPPVPDHPPARPRCETCGQPLPDDASTPNGY